MNSIKKLFMFSILFLLIVGFNVKMISAMSQNPENDNRTIGYEIINMSDWEYLHFWGQRDFWVNRTSANGIGSYKGDTQAEYEMIYGFNLMNNWEIYRQNEFNVDWIDLTNNLTFTNHTAWNNINKLSRDIRYAFRWSTTSFTPQARWDWQVKNIGSLDIGVEFGVGVNIKNIKVKETVENDYIHYNWTTEPLSGNETIIITNFSRIVNNETVYDTCVLLDDKTSWGEYQYIKWCWNESLPATLVIRPQANHSNRQVYIIFRTTGLAVGQSKMATLFYEDPLSSGYVTPINPYYGGWVDNPSTINLTCEFSANGDEIVNASIMNGTQYLLTEWPGELQSDNALWDDNLIFYLRINNNSDYDENQSQIYDHAQFKNNATIVGSTINHNRAGRFDKGWYNFGQAEYIQVPHHASTNPTSGTVTLSFWAKSNRATWNNYAYFISKRNQFLFGPWINQRRVDFWIRNSSNEWCGPSITPDDIEIWHMYTLVFNGSHTVGYVDGVEEGASLCNDLLSTDTGDMFIGKDDGNARYINGSMDEILIWNKSLTALEVSQYYNLTRDTYVMNKTISAPNQQVNSYGCYAWDNTSASKWNNASYLIDPVSLWLPENDSTDTDGEVTFLANVTCGYGSECKNISLYTNQSGVWAINKTLYPGELYDWYDLYNDNLLLLVHLNNDSSVGESQTVVRNMVDYFNGTPGGVAQPNVSGRFQGAYQFADTSGQFIDFGHNNLWNDTNFTISTWFKIIAEVGDDQAIISKYESGCGSDKQWILKYSENTNEVQLFSVSGATNEHSDSGANSVNPGDWTHVIATYTIINSTAANVTFFINGVKIAGDLPHLVRYDNTECEVNIGSWDDGGDDQFNGLIDETVVWNVILTDTQAYTIYNLSKSKFVFNHTLTTISDGSYLWNIKATNNRSDVDWGNSNWTFNVTSASAGDTAPTVILHSPPDNNVSTSGNVTFTCNITDDQYIQNVSLYGNWTTTGWGLNQTINLGGTNSSYQANFSVNFTSNASYIWNCLAYDNNSNSSWDINRTVIINITAGGEADPCTPPAINNDWNVVDQNCVLTTNTNLGSGYVNFTRSTLNVTNAVLQTAGTRGLNFYLFGKNSLINTT